MEISQFELLNRPASKYNYLLFSLLFLIVICLERDQDETIDVDAPIKELFCEDFDEKDFLFIKMAFELNHGYDIPNVYLDYDQTLREFTTRVSQLPHLSIEDFGKHLQEIVLIAEGL